MGFGETILPPLVFPHWVLPDVGPNGHADDKSKAPQSHGVKNEDGAPNAAKHVASSKGKTFMLDSDEEDETLPIGNEQ